MNIWLRLALAIILFFGAAFGAAIWVGTIRWNSTTSQMVGTLLAPPAGRPVEAVSLRNFGNLPAPVVRYFRMALKDGQQSIRSARIAHQGEFLTSPATNGWSSFTSTQHFSVYPPGFVWDASIRFAPLMDVRVRDAYLAGKGTMEARTFAVLPVMDQRDKSELDQGALQRYLAEAAWFPTALLPQSGVVWSAIDRSRALATLVDSGVKASLEFTFNETGEITRIYSAGRYRETGGTYVHTPWVVRVWNYAERAGMRIPLEGEASWQLPGFLQPYWKGTITDAQYVFEK